VEPIVKLSGFEFWRVALRSARYVVAPMVDQSDYAWRILSRRYNAELCYTPMFHAKLFSDARSSAYREEHWKTGPGDRPLIVQFCANDPEQLLNAARLVERECDAVDINLGCPQDIARRGRYGSFLQDDWPLIESMVRKLDQELAVPVTCKIRVFPDVERTVRYAKMLEAAGCQLLTVHGRVREQRGHLTGLADWEQIRRVKLAVNIPVFANGNILELEDVEECIRVAGCDGVMTAEGNLYNPALFSGQHPPVWQMAEEYLEICQTVPTKLAYIRGHLFKLFKPCLSIHVDVRTRLAEASSLEEIVALTTVLKTRLLDDADASLGKIESDPSTDRTKHPHWNCQPYIRPPHVPNERKRDPEESVKPRKVKKPRSTSCVCGNIFSDRCPDRLCRTCCRRNIARTDCPVHRRHNASSLLVELAAQ